jgi:hypothetical protein
VYIQQFCCHRAGNDRFWKLSEPQFQKGRDSCDISSTFQVSITGAIK